MTDSGIELHFVLMSGKRYKGTFDPQATVEQVKRHIQNYCDATPPPGISLTLVSEDRSVQLQNEWGLQAAKIVDGSTIQVVAQPPPAICEQCGKKSDVDVDGIISKSNYSNRRCTNKHCRARFCQRCVHGVFHGDCPRCGEGSFRDTSGPCSDWEANWAPGLESTDSLADQELCGPSNSAHAARAIPPEDIDLGLVASRSRVDRVEERLEELSSVLYAAMKDECDRLRLAVEEKTKRISELEGALEEERKRRINVEQENAKLQTNASARPPYSGDGHASVAGRVPLNIFPASASMGYMEPPFRLVKVTEQREPRFLVCVLCEDHISGLFTHSWNLLGEVLNCSATPVPVNDNSVYQQLRAGGTRWCDQHVSSMEYFAGGLKALGAGSNQKRLERAARIAIVVTVCCTKPDTTPPDPTNDGALGRLVGQVRVALQNADAPLS